MPGQRRFTYVPELELVNKEPVSVENAITDLESFLKLASTQEGDTYDLSWLGTTSEAVRRQIPVDSAFAGPQAASVPYMLDVLRSEWLPKQGHPDLARCFCRVKARMSIHLHPGLLGSKVLRGVRKAAKKILMRWSTDLECVPWAITEVTPAGNLGAIVSDSPWVHFLANISALGFAPERGQWLKATMSGPQPWQGISVSVCHVQDAFVKAKYLPPTLSFDEEQWCWTCKTDGQPIPTDSTVWFQVDEITAGYGGMLKLYGCIDWKGSRPEHMIRPSKRTAADLRKLQLFWKEDEEEEEKGKSKGSEGASGSASVLKQPASSSSTPKATRGESKDEEGKTGADSGSKDKDGKPKADKAKELPKPDAKVAKAMTTEGKPDAGIAKKRGRPPGQSASSKKDTSKRPKT
mmetsp:Transcript_62178/g.115392  ORF Transcript_62178/g.115392 Transcript_62178/m.115392 type:complete len:406 (-) Transcript_62178:102-1319(-)